jgi:hypothetical protein
MIFADILVLHVYENGSFIPSSSVFNDLMLHAIYGPLCQHLLVNLELFPILVAIFKHYKVTSQQMDTYHKVTSSSTSQLVTCSGYQHPQRLDFLNSNMSRLVAWGVTTRIGQDKKANI